MENNFFREWDYLYDRTLDNTFYSKDAKWFPRSWFYLYKCVLNFLNENKHKIKTILEVGTWEIWFLANSIWKAYVNICIEATEKDYNAFDNVSKYNTFLKNVKIFHTDRFPNTKTQYDLIVSNPPQMPMEYIWKNHDYGWYDGLDTIDFIIKEWISRKPETLLIIMNVFDFLWVESQFWRDRSIMSIVYNLWWKINVLWKDKRYIRKWWETYNNRRFIETISPGFLFSEDEKWQFHSMYVIEILFQ